jgi:hypothetical protein
MAVALGLSVGPVKAAVVASNPPPEPWVLMGPQPSPWVLHS